MTKKVSEQVADEKYRMFKRAGYSEDRARREQAATREYFRRMAEQRSKDKR
ncbi:hypothetical protein GCM10010112_43710 [Actinoplanes lobatus]|uniref:Uncharacterized protein n=2 Tax=Actinoplanes TaxID=1865 RepID=A0ABQ3WN23_9ACTN|nr:MULTISPECIES: hypothetical protein [Actinoplanes]MBB4747590.1 hypothetical protein [Actinoplanes lobatus]GGN74007.1 hypothetical protein GCM10010112_43710 [Actinoplanes lobatus]GID47638.1 hypothetical protein Aca07nite_49130 [Actinoplanes capillaceus]GIE39849.1 hypothetical protein Alo02nite_27470 [Actinoplanes lobatus]